MRTTYAKLKSGEWGLRVQGAASEGAMVTVTKRDGSTKVERIGKVIWRGGGITLCAIDAGAPRSSDRDSYGNSIRTGASYRAGVTAPHGGACANCGSRECSAAWGSGPCVED